MVVVFVCRSLNPSYIPGANLTRSMAEMTCLNQCPATFPWGLKKRAFVRRVEEARPELTESLLPLPQAPHWSYLTKS